MSSRLQNFMHLQNSLLPTQRNFQGPSLLENLTSQNIHQDLCPPPKKAHTYCIGTKWHRVCLYKARGSFLTVFFLISLDIIGWIRASDCTFLSVFLYIHNSPFTCMRFCWWFWSQFSIYSPFLLLFLPLLFSQYPFMVPTIFTLSLIFHTIHSFTLFVVFKLFMHVPHYSRLFPRYVILHNNTIIPTSSFIAETSLLFWFCILLLPNHFHPSFRLICFNYSYSFLFPPSYSFSNPPHDPFSLFSLFLFCSRQTPASNKITITVLGLPTS